MIVIHDAGHGKFEWVSFQKHFDDERKAVVNVLPASFVLSRGAIQVVKRSTVEN